MSEAVSIQKWVTPNPATVESDATLGSAIAIMARLKIGAILVMEDKRLVGVFTERDLVQIVGEHGSDVTGKSIREFMTAKPITASMDEDYNAVYTKMRSNNIRHIPILDGASLVGIVSIRDLIHFYQNKLESEFAEARERIEELKGLINLSTEEMLESLFAEINKYKELSLTDHLTGLYNKRYFNMRLTEETSRAVRYEQDLALIFCDIDHFKNINDNFGHSFGDHVLVKIGRVLRGEVDDLSVISRLRKSDIIARYGGEEFVVILPETGERNATIAAEKMRKAIENLSFRHEEQAVVVTMSFGVAGVDEDTRSMDDLVRNADHAMYHAKQSGRNCVVSYTDAKDKQ
jgi:diguanylate cyclase (GGDEF)-like protein